MNKTGRVLYIKDNYACIRTVKGEFYQLKIKGDSPKVGDIYRGSPDKSLLTYSIFGICLLIIICIMTFSILFFTPTNSIILEGDCTYKMKVNRFNYVISCTATSEKGYKILSSVDILNSPLDDSLCNLLASSLNEKAIKNSNNIKPDLTLYISGNTEPDINTFRNFAFSNNLRLAINYNGTDLSLGK